MPDTFRTFVALELPDSLREIAHRLIGRFPDTDQYRWVRKENLHLTLNFLGDVPQQELSSVCKGIQQTLSPFSAFQVGLHGVGAFPKPDRPRVVWVGVDQGNKELSEIQSSAATTIDALGFDRDRNKFHPHVTLGRLKKDRRFSSEMIRTLAAHKSTEIGEYWVKELVVFGSFLEKEGPNYTPMARIQLAG